MGKVKERRMREKRSRAGRLGGMTTLARHGAEHFAELGKSGGRPRKDYEQILYQRLAAEAKNKTKEVPEGEGESVSGRRRYIQAEIKRQRQEPGA